MGGAKVSVFFLFSKNPNKKNGIGLRGGVSEWGGGGAGVCDVFLLRVQI